MPITPDLASRAEVLAFQFRTAARVCRFSSLGPVIRGDEVCSVALDAEGVVGRPEGAFS